MVDRTQSDGLNGNSFKIHAAAGNNVMTTLLFLFVLLTRTDRQTDTQTHRMCFLTRHLIGKKKERNLFLLFLVLFFIRIFYLSFSAHRVNVLRPSFVLCVFFPSEILSNSAHF